MHLPWVLAAEGIPASSPLTQMTTPLAILIFLGSTYMLLRSNLGTKRGYLVLSTSLFGFLMLFSLFWAYGAPGTPQATGPTNLPGQASDEIQPKWVPFAADSLLIERGDLSFARQYPEGFEAGEVTDDGFVFPSVSPELTGNIQTGVEETTNFFSSEAAGEVIESTWVIQDIGYAQTDTGFPLVGLTFQEVDEGLQPVADGETVTAFAYFDAGTPLLPAQLIFLGSLLLFVLHAWLLDRDERLERTALREAREEPAEADPVPARA